MRSLLFTTGLFLLIASTMACGDTATTSSSNGGSGGATTTGEGGTTSQTQSETTTGGSGGGGATGGTVTTGGSGGATGGSGGATGGAGGAPPMGCAETIGTNHGHTLEVTQDDVTAGVDKTYDIQGSSMHSHMVTITAADFANLAGGGTLMVTSTTGAAHTHQITVTCP